MPFKLRFFLIATVLIFFVIVIKGIKKSKISNDMATVWILFCLSLLAISIFPKIVTLISKVLGIQSNMNTLYLIIIAILLVLVFYLYLRISILEEKIKNVIQEISINNKSKKNKDD